MVGKIKVSRYLNFIEKKLDAQHIAATHQIPTRRTRNQKKVQSQEDQITFDELSNTFDNWKARGNDGLSPIKENQKATKQRLDNSQKGKKVPKPKMFFNKQNLKLKK